MILEPRVETVDNEGHYLAIWQNDKTLHGGLGPMSFPDLYFFYVRLGEAVHSCALYEHRKSLIKMREDAVSK